MTAVASSRPTAFTEKGFFTGIGAKRDGAFKKSKHVRTVRASSPNGVKRVKLNGTVSEDRENVAPGPGGQRMYPHFKSVTAEPNADEYDDPFDSIVCKHCKKTVLKETAKDHIAGCLKSKQEKARKKKEAREAAQRAKERAERADDDDDDDDDVKDGKRGKLGEDAKGKKKRADDDDSKPNRKKKKDDKPKTAKPKGPVDVERQCGVPLPNGQLCARSLTCKSHSMGAKRAVPGRSQRYDVLLAAYQKKNQARQQKAAIDANAAALFDDEADTMAGPIDSDEERDAVMTAISRNIARPQPLVTRSLVPIRRKYQLVRVKEMLSNAMTGNRSGGLFSVTAASPNPPGSAVNEHFAIPATTPIQAVPNTPTQAAFMPPPAPREPVDVA